MMFSCSLSGGVRPEGREGWILRTGTARPPKDRVVRACDGTAAPPVAAASVQVGAGWLRGSRYPRCVRSLPGHACAPGPSHDFPTHGSPIPRPDAAGVAPRTMLYLAGLSTGLRASPLRGQRDVLQHRGQLLLVGGAVEPPVETASAQLRILCLACRHQRNRHVHIAAMPLQVPTQDELILIFQYCQGNPQLHRPALPFMIQRVCGSNSENSFSSCGIVSPSSTRRRT